MGREFNHAGLLLYTFKNNRLYVILKKSKLKDKLDIFWGKKLDYEQYVETAMRITCKQTYGAVKFPMKTNKYNFYQCVIHKNKYDKKVIYVETHEVEPNIKDKFIENKKKLQDVMMYEIKLIEFNFDKLMSNKNITDIVKKGIQKLYDDLYYMKFPRKIKYKKKKSCGFLLYTIINRRLYIALGLDRYSFNWGLFKGRKKKRENDIETATRETYEETCRVIDLRKKNFKKSHFKLYGRNFIGLTYIKPDIRRKFIENRNRERKWEFLEMLDIQLFRYHFAGIMGNNYITNTAKNIIIKFKLELAYIKRQIEW